MSDFDVVHHFMAVTGVRDDNVAVEYLAMTDFNCDEAVAIFMAAHGGSSQRQHIAETPPEPSGETLFAQLLRESSARGPQPAVAHPPSFVEELNDDDEQPSQSGRGTLAEMYRFPPYAFNFFFNPENEPNNYMGSIDRHKTFPQCCTAALETQRWVLLLVFDEMSFVFQCLLRDIFNDSTVAAVLPDMAVLFLVEQASEQGQQLVATYRLKSPTRDAAGLHDVLVVDPLTRALVSKLSLKANATGIFDPSHFLEKVTDIMLGREHPSQKMVRNNSNPILPPAPLAPTAAPAIVAVEDDDDDAELQQALKMSEEQNDSTQSPKRKMQKTEVPSFQVPDLSDILVAKGTPEAFPLRFRFPNGVTEELVFHNEARVERILSYACAKSGVLDDALLELRGGFPPRPMSLNKAATLSQSPVLRKGDLITVQVRDQ